MPDLITTSLLLFLVGLIAGTLNVIAGGGSLLTLPVLIFLGLPPTVANGTNRVAIIVQNIGASWSFHRRGLLSKDWLLLAIPPALLGALLGSYAAVHIDDLAFQKILAVILVASAAWMLWHPAVPPLQENTELPRGPKRWGFIAAFFLIGVYGGFIQAGIGFLILAVASAAGFDLIRSNALKVTLVLVFMPIALTIFAWNGKVDWVMGLTLAAGNFLGGQAGVHLQILKGHKWVRAMVTITIILFALRLLFSD